ncbi:rhodanese-like domain-containing protein [Bernardetia sp.]|uniref:rhodanese-like domain-containing protein n=1 Tax=Bernardetia sp. TaxID=1937974 RepID=UPI0025C29F94|nr:rhodanese-like domain-containing protein [Bernardetia sp.]
MKKSIFIIAFFSLFVSITSCNNTKKADTTTNTEQTEVTNQKVEKLEAPEFRIKMAELKLYNIVDVRTPQEFEQASILKAKNIDINGDSFEEELSKLEKDKPLFLYCKSGGRSARAVEKAKEMGFERIIELDGGFESWKAAKIETQHGM